MGSNVSHSVEVQISNNTRSITLRNPKTFSNCGHWSAPPVPELSPGSSGTCHFLGSSSYKVGGLLVYEAESFTLAIHFSSPTKHNMFPMELGLELSPGKVHLGRLVHTYSRMASGTYSRSHRDLQFNRAVVGRSHGTVQVSKGNVKVRATMSSGTDSLLKVLLEEPEELWEEAR